MKSSTSSWNGKARTRSGIELDAVGSPAIVQRLVHRRAGRAEVDHAEPRRLGPPARTIGLRHQLLGGLELRSSRCMLST